MQEQEEGLLGNVPVGGEDGGEDGGRQRQRQRQRDRKERQPGNDLHLGAVCFQRGETKRSDARHDGCCCSLEFVVSPVVLLSFLPANCAWAVCGRCGLLCSISVALASSRYILTRYCTQVGR